jgi:hypothetical protein
MATKLIAASMLALGLASISLMRARRSPETSAYVADRVTAPREVSGLAPEAGEAPAGAGKVGRPGRARGGAPGLAPGAGTGRRGH